MTTPDKKAGTPPPELSDNEKKVLDAMKRVGATTPEAARAPDEILRQARLPKGQLMALLEGLERKGYAKHVKRQKSSAYHTTR